MCCTIRDGKLLLPTVVEAKVHYHDNISCCWFYGFGSGTLCMANPIWMCTIGFGGGYGV